MNPCRRSSSVRDAVSRCAALAAATTILVREGRARFGLLTALPLTWLLSVTMTAGWQKIFHADRRVGFLAQADHLAAQLAAGAVPPEKVLETHAVIFNNRLDAALTALFMVLVAVVVLDAARVWWRTLRPPRPAPGVAPRPLPALPAASPGRSGTR